MSLRLLALGYANHPRRVGRVGGKPKLLSLLLLVRVLLFFSYPPNFHSPISATCGSNPQSLGPPGPFQGCRLPHPKSDWPASAAGPRGTWQSGWRHHCPLIRLCALLGYGCTQPRTHNLCCTPVESGSDPILIHDSISIRRTAVCIFI